MKMLSTKLTFFSKVIFPAGWLSFSIFMWLASIFEMNGAIPHEELDRGIWCIWIAGTAFLLWRCIGLKRVCIDETHLYVSNFIKEISIPLNMIIDVKESWWDRTHKVTVYFRTATEFGQSITFSPPVRFFPLTNSHPVAVELKRIAGLGDP